MFAWYRDHLHGLILAGVGLGLVVGAALNAASVPTGPEAPAGFVLFHTLDALGQVFLSLLEMVIIPVIVVSITFGLGSMDKGGGVGRIAGYTVGYYLVTTTAAVSIGLTMVLLFDPGEGAAIEETVAQMLEEGSTDAGLAAQIEAADEQMKASSLEGLEGGLLMFKKLQGLATSLVPSNVFEAMAQGRFLPIIVFSILLGATLLVVRERAPLLLDLFEQAQTLFFALLEGIMTAAPIGFFALVASLAWTVGLSGVGTIWVYALAVIAGLLAHALVVLPLLCLLVARRNPARYALQMREPLVMAFSTASSSATLPVTLRTVQDRAGIRRDHAAFVLPLGATVNMDGTAIYESIALITLLQAFAAASGLALDMSFVDMLVIVLTVTLAAIGAAGLPGAGIFMLIMLLGSVQVGEVDGVPAHLIGLILVLDRPLDMLRTATNVWGDAIGTAVVARLSERG